MDVGWQEEPLLDQEERRRRGWYHILMVSDFFFPNMGGVEMHIYQLSQCLLRQGHKVVVLARSVNDTDACGVRYLSNGLKVIYAPKPNMYNGTSMPNGGAWWAPYFKNILLREEIDVIHAHQAFSAQAHEALQYSMYYGLKCCFTDHSLHGFADVSGILVNKLLRWSLCNVGHCICVSHTSKENLVLRARLRPRDVSVIPNAVDASQFQPRALEHEEVAGGSSSSGGAGGSSSSGSAGRSSSSSGGALSTVPASGRQGTAAGVVVGMAGDEALSESGRPIVNIVVVSRLAYRKGMDLLVGLIPEICSRYDFVNFIIAGDGPKKVELDEVREKFQLHDRVEFVGSVANHEVRDVLVRGDIFVNCSLTEAFCIAIVEAASCGLLVVSTDVGGVPEVLPHDMLTFAPPTVEGLSKAVASVIPRVGTVDRWEMHRRVNDMYNWDDVAERTAKVYDRLVHETPISTRLERIWNMLKIGRYAGIIFVFVLTFAYFFIDWLIPAMVPDDDIDIAPALSPFYCRIPRRDFHVAEKEKS